MAKIACRLINRGLCGRSELSAKPGVRM